MFCKFCLFSFLLVVVVVANTHRPIYLNTY